MKRFTQKIKKLSLKENIHSSEAGIPEVVFGPCDSRASGGRFAFVLALVQAVHTWAAHVVLAMTIVRAKQITSTWRSLTEDYMLKIRFVEDGKSTTCQLTACLHHWSHRDKKKWQNPWFSQTLQLTQKICLHKIRREFCHSNQWLPMIHLNSLWSCSFFGLLLTDRQKFAGAL